MLHGSVCSGWDGAASLHPRAAHTPDTLLLSWGTSLLRLPQKGYPGLGMGMDSWDVVTLNDFSHT